MGHSMTIERRCKDENTRRFLEIYETPPYPGRVLSGRTKYTSGVDFQTTPRRVDAYSFFLDRRSWVSKDI